MNTHRSMPLPRTPHAARFLPLISVRAVHAVALACALAASSTHARPPAAEEETQAVISSITPEDLRDIMKAEGYEAVIDKNNVVIWKLEGFKSQLFVAEDSEAVQYHTSFRDGKATLKRVNEWNRTKRFSRTYLDDNGDPHLELDLDLEGGVTVDRLLDFLKTCRASFDAWCKEVVE
jgi:hypothetical protein